METNAIHIEHMAYWYNPLRVILDNIDLVIAENDFIAILGQNGSGKTTLLKNISGLLRPAQGRILIRGKDAGKMGVAEIAGEIGFVMQESDRQLFESTVYDEVAFSLKRKAAADAKDAVRQKTEEALAAVGLLDKQDAFPLALNRAERIKTVFASVLAMGPRIIMLDEPVAGQDYRGSRMVMDLIAALHRQNRTIIMVTHNIDIAAEYARRVIVMNSGRVVMDGSPADVFCREEELAGAGILPPHITRLSGRLRREIPLEQDALLPAELAEMLVRLKR